MKRDQLKELGLQDDAIDKIMSINGSDIEKAKSSNTEIAQENEELKKQIKERDKDLKQLRNNAKDNKELTKSYEELQAKYDKDTADLSNKLSKTRLNSALDSALLKSNVRNTKAIKGFLDMSRIKLDKEGNLTGLDDQIDAIKKTDGYLFDEGQRQDYMPTNGKPNKPDETQEMIDVFKGGAK